MTGCCLGEVGRGVTDTAKASVGVSLSVVRE